LVNRAISFCFFIPFGGRLQGKTGFDFPKIFLKFLYLLKKQVWYAEDSFKTEKTGKNHMNRLKEIME